MTSFDSMISLFKRNNSTYHNMEKENFRVRDPSYIIYEFIKGGFIVDTDGNSEHDTFDFWRAFFGNDVTNFEKILLSYYLRMFHIQNIDFVHSSAYYNGNTVNILLKAW